MSEYFLQAVYFSKHDISGVTSINILFDLVKQTKYFPPCPRVHTLHNPRAETQRVWQKDLSTSPGTHTHNVGGEMGDEMGGIPSRNEQVRDCKNIKE